MTVTTPQPAHPPTTAPPAPGTGTAAGRGPRRRTRSGPRRTHRAAANAAGSNPKSTPPSQPLREEQLFTGIFRAHARGFGFIDLDTPAPVPAAEPVTSCFVPPPLASGLLSDDQVQVAVDTSDGRGTATSVRVTYRARHEVFGVAERTEHGQLMLRLDPHTGHGRWRLTTDAAGDPATAGHAVLATIVPDTDRTAAVTASWPDPVGPDALRARIVARHQIVPSFPTDVLDQADTIAAGHAPPSPDPLAAHRRDLRDLVTITIDDPSTRDLDDAVSVYPADADGGIRVLVHIADVAAHVPASSPADVEARRTGTSVYLPGWTRPMLPPVLSESALSLLPGVDRDALTVEMRLDADGVVTAADVFASTVRSTGRVSYTQAADVMVGHTPDGLAAEVVDALRWLRTAAARLGVQRARRGGVDARRVEPELAVDVVNGTATQVTAAPSTPAHLMIERLMVAANEAVAGWLLDRGLPGMFRTHPTPGAGTAAALETFCTGAGYHPGFGAGVTPLGLAALSTQLDGADEQTSAAVWDVLLSNLGRAQYTPVLGEHFGLGSSAYLHFTSPIRRYADLAVHRIVHAYLSGARSGAAFPTRGDLTMLAEHLNTAAGVAARAEAQAVKALWLVTLDRHRADHPRTVLRGRVSGVNAKGVFVTLEASLVTGFVATRNLPGRVWSPTDTGFALQDAGGRTVGLGDQISVRIVSADVETGQLELRVGPVRPAGDRDRDRRTDDRARSRAPRRGAGRSRT